MWELQPKTNRTVGPPVVVPLTVLWVPLQLAMTERFLALMWQQ